MPYKVAVEYWAIFPAAEYKRIEVIAALSDHKFAIKLR